MTAANVSNLQSLGDIESEIVTLSDYRIENSRKFYERLMKP